MFALFLWGFATQPDLVVLIFSFFQGLFLGPDLTELSTWYPPRPLLVGRPFYVVVSFTSDGHQKCLPLQHLTVYQRGSPKMVPPGPLIGVGGARSDMNKNKMIFQTRTPQISHKTHMLISAKWSLNKSKNVIKTKIIIVSTFVFVRIFRKMKMQTTMLIWGFGGPGPLHKKSSVFYIHFEYGNKYSGNVFY